MILNNQTPPEPKNYLMERYLFPSESHIPYPGALSVLMSYYLGGAEY